MKCTSTQESYDGRIGGIVSRLVESGVDLQMPGRTIAPPNSPGWGMNVLTGVHRPGAADLRNNQQDPYMWKVARGIVAPMDPGLMLLKGPNPGFDVSDPSMPLAEQKQILLCIVHVCRVGKSGDGRIHIALSGIGPEKPGKGSSRVLKMEGLYSTPDVGLLTVFPQISSSQGLVYKSTPPPVQGNNCSRGPECGTWRRNLAAS